MATTHPQILIGNTFTEVNIPHHNVQPKLKAQAGFVKNSMVLYPSLYIYNDDVMSDDLL